MRPAAGQQDRGHAGRADRVLAAVGQDQDAVRGVADAEPAGTALPGQAHLGQARVQGLGEQRVRAQVLGQYHLAGRAGHGALQGGVGTGMRAGQQRDHNGQRRPRPLGRGGQRVVQGVLAALQVGDLDVGTLTGQPGLRGDPIADLIAGRAGAARHREQESRRVRGQAQPVRTAMPTGPAGTAGPPGQRPGVLGRFPALRQRFPALRQRVTPLGQRVSAPGERVTPLGQRFPALGQRVSAPGERVTPLGQRFPALGQRVSAPRERVAPLGQRVSAPGERVAPLGQRVSAFRQRIPAPGQRVRSLARVSHDAVSYSGFTRHDRRSLMFGRQQPPWLLHRVFAACYAPAGRRAAHFIVSPVRPGAGAAVRAGAAARIFGAAASWRAVLG